MTFALFCRAQRTTYAEKDALAWHLAQMRARRIYERLRPQPRYSRNERTA